MLDTECKYHLALPKRNGIDEGRLNLLKHLSIVVLKKSGLRTHLNGNHTGKFKVMKLLLKTVAKVCKVIVCLSIFLSAGLFCFLTKLFEFYGSGLLKSLLTCNDVHGKFFVIFHVKVVHLVEHSNVLHKYYLMILKVLNNLVYVSFCFGICIL